MAVGYFPVWNVFGMVGVFVMYVSCVLMCVLLGCVGAFVRFGGDVHRSVFSSVSLQGVILLQFVFVVCGLQLTVGKAGFVRMCVFMSCM